MYSFLQKKSILVKAFVTEIILFCIIKICSKKKAICMAQPVVFGLGAHLPRNRRLETRRIDFRTGNIHEGSCQGSRGIVTVECYTPAPFPIPTGVLVSGEDSGDILILQYNTQVTRILIKHYTLCIPKDIIGILKNM